MAKARVGIPINHGELIDLCVSIGKAHTKQGAKSPLSILDWDKINPDIAEADELDDRIDELTREIEKLIQRRKTLVERSDGLGGFARQARDILTGVYRNEMKKLGDFGFEVNDSPKAKKTAEKKPTA